MDRVDQSTVLTNNVLTDDEAAVKLLPIGAPEKWDDVCEVGCL